uniref:Uncharacterized protein n=1 Tax=Lepeophtheirus salmonis TaxID=72036 RepID=A0A0K2UGL3_LEPSM
MMLEVAPLWVSFLTTFPYDFLDDVWTDLINYLDPKTSRDTFIKFSHTLHRLVLKQLFLKSWMNNLFWVHSSRRRSMTCNDDILTLDREYFVVHEGNPASTVITLDTVLRYLGDGSDRALDIYICSYRPELTLCHIKTKERSPEEYLQPLGRLKR